jgi:peptide-methionine (S)-S-oxide reductase
MRIFRLMTVLVLAVAVIAQASPARAAALRKAIFAGGCFWSMEQPFDRIEGVTKVVAGFAGGVTPNPTYKQVSDGGTGHHEVVAVVYDPDKVSYETLLDVYWRNIDPFDGEGQFCDKGDQYKSVIFVDGPKERAAAEASRTQLVNRFGQGIVTDIRDLDVSVFYPAEDRHQDYAVKHPWRYKFYRSGCKRDKRLEAIWGDEAGGYGFGQTKVGR